MTLPPERYDPIYARLAALRHRRWRLNHHGLVIAHDPDASPIATLSAQYSQWRRADAQLIARAPEDLAELLAAVARIRDQVESQDYVRELEAEMRRLKLLVGEQVY